MVITHNNGHAWIEVMSFLKGFVLHVHTDTHVLKKIYVLES